MSVNKSYKQGASDIGKVAGTAFKAVSNETKGISAEIHDDLKMQTEINNGIFDIIDEHEVRFMIHEIGYRPIDMKTIYNFQLQDKTVIGSIIGNIVCTDAGKDYVRNLIACLGVTIDDNIERLPKLSGEPAEACAMFLYKLMLLCSDNEISNQIENAIDMLIISGDDSKRIKRQVCKLKEKFGNNFGEFLFSEIYNQERFIGKSIDRKKVSRKIKAVLAGKTGSGKSTLVNSIFEFENAEVNIGKPVTQVCRLYQNSSETIQIYDTIGFRIGNEESIINDLITLIKNNDVNVLLYCVHSSSHRFEDFEAELISKFRDENKNLKVFIVLTCCVDHKEAKELSKYIKSLTNHPDVIPVMAKRYETDAVTIEPFGIQELIEKITSD